jgi:hypothetical protein
LVVKAEAIDQSLGLGQSEQARPGVARLGLWRHGTDFNKSKAKSRQAIDVGSVLVEACGQANPVRESQTCQLNRT